MEKIIGITEARTTIKNLVDRVSEQNETYIIAQDSKPQAVIISYDEYIRNRTIIEVNKKLRFEKVLEEKTVVVLDTNILISAVLFKGTPLKILQLCVSKNKIDVAISPELLAEFIGKLKYKFGIKN
jgi:prevent-host-death family protein